MNTKRKGINDFKIDGDITIIYITAVNNLTYEVLIDTEDLPKLQELDFRWGIRNLKHELLYVRTSYRYGEAGNRKGNSIYLHRLITGADFSKREYVDHINHNTLDNRKCNLRVTQQQKNTTNRKSKNINNNSGYRNVCWDNSSKRWLVQIIINGKNKVVGRFKKDEIEQAGKFAEEMRQKYYKDFKGMA